MRSPQPRRSRSRGHWSLIPPLPLRGEFWLIRGPERTPLRHLRDDMRSRGDTKGDREEGGRDEGAYQFALATPPACSRLGGETSRR